MTYRFITNTAALLLWGKGMLYIVDGQTTYFNLIIQPFPISSHASVFDVLAVHEHVLMTQSPDTTSTRLNVTLEHLTALDVHLWSQNLVDAVRREQRHRNAAGEKNTDSITNIIILNYLIPLFHFKICMNN